MGSAVDVMRKDLRSVEGERGLASVSRLAFLVSSSMAARVWYFSTSRCNRPTFFSYSFILEACSPRRLKRAISRSFCKREV